MSGLCTAPSGGGFISSTTSWIDCQAQTLGSGAWSVLATPGSTLSVVLTGFLTIFIAIIGYDLLLGRTMTVRSGTLAAVKIGAVFALATSWPAYRTLVYDLVVDGPGQIVSEIGPSANVVGADGSLLQRLDEVDRGLAQLAILGPGSAIDASNVPPAPFGGFDSFALGGSRIVFLIVAVASLAGIRLITGLMLALGPFFIAFLLFDNTRSLFEGWIRVLGGAALAAIGVSLTLGLELAMIEPWLSSALAQRAAGAALPTISVELLVITSLFAILTCAALFACSRTVRAFRLAPVSRLILSPRERGTNAPTGAWTRQLANDRVERERSRAAVVAQLIAGSRQSRLVASPGVGMTRLTVSKVRDSAEVARTSPVGRSFRRRASSRVSASANRRDAHS